MATSIEKFDELLARGKKRAAEVESAAPEAVVQCESIFRTAEGFDFGVATMDGNTVFRFATAFGDDFGVTSGAVVSDDFGNEVVRALGAFVHDADKTVRAVGALVCNCRCDFSARRTGTFSKPDKRLGALLRVSRRT